MTILIVGAVGSILIFIVILTLVGRRRKKNLVPVVTSEKVTSQQVPHEISQEVPEQTPVEPDNLENKSHVAALRIFCIPDPLSSNGILSAQINKAESSIPEIAVKELIASIVGKRENIKNLTSGYAKRHMVNGRLAMILIGEVEAITKSTAPFHPEIKSAIDSASQSSDRILLVAIDGLVYSVIS